jgi:hypothetical protein
MWAGWIREVPQKRQRQPLGKEVHRNVLSVFCQCHHGLMIDTPLVLLTSRWGDRSRASAIQAHSYLKHVVRCSGWPRTTPDVGPKCPLKWIADPAPRDYFGRTRERRWSAECVVNGRVRWLSASRRPLRTCPPWGDVAGSGVVSESWVAMANPRQLIPTPGAAGHRPAGPLSMAPPRANVSGKARGSNHVRAARLRLS